MRNDSVSRQSVHKVIRLVATHPDSWEDAARVGVAEATKTMRDLAMAKVTELDVTIDDAGVRRHRVKLELAFRLDRRRPGAAAGAADVEVRRYLVVANQTLAGAELRDVVAGRVAAGPAEFHVLVPATYSKEFSAARRLALTADPTVGYTVGELAFVELTDVAGIAQATERLDAQLDALRSAGADVTGEVGDADPLTAIATVLSRGSFDEIILSTLPPGISRWLNLDLPSRVERSFSLPVTHVSSAAT